LKNRTRVRTKKKVQLTLKKLREGRSNRSRQEEERMLWDKAKYKKGANTCGLLCGLSEDGRIWLGSRIRRRDCTNQAKTKKRNVLSDGGVWEKRKGIVGSARGGNGEEKRALGCAAVEKVGREEKKRKKEERGDLIDTEIAVKTKRRSTITIKEETGG